MQTRLPTKDANRNNFPSPLAAYDMQQAPENFGDCIRRLRRCLVLSQKDLARLLGVSYVSLNRWENGCYAPSPLAVQRLDDFCERASTIEPKILALADWLKNYRQSGNRRGRNGRTGEHQDERAGS